ncbi:MAG: hypothetical protein DWQ44_04200 [Bacteroidetes bacterium]|nr:MAG: hypothetical protein DWQ33_11590 [Bacteroidota bacterium]REK00726.1 MAG: hypothetical protein DWQ39_11265 [Bacteroidota bacterium]REK35152.1 MAG: hypothetical protein DWQ44_04200 [Bacteroidota bacterium]REK48229.1 MAG: hypothetical protein DWQ48_10400 [Bacteroidota bacterium]
MRKYITYLGVLIVSIFAAIILAGVLLPRGYVDSITWGILLYFLFTTLVFHVGLLRSSEGRPQVFVRYYMASTTLKLLLHMGVILIYSIFNKPDAMRFIITFLIFYIVFTAFEVGVVWKQFRKNN